MRLLLLACSIATSPFAFHSPPPHDSVAWGEPIEGFAVGLYTDTPVVKPGELPKLYFVVENRSSQDIAGFLMGGDLCVVELNNVFFTFPSQGGKMSQIRAGEQFPVAIDIPFERFYRTDALRSPEDARWDSVIHSPHPELRAGKNTIVVYFYFGPRWQKFARSGQITIEVR